MWCLIFLRRLGGEHTFFVNPEYVAAFQELMADTQISIRPLSEAHELGTNCWIADGQFEGEGVVWQYQHDIMAFVASYYNAMARRIIGRNVFNAPEDMLWDAPCLNPGILPKVIDYLVISADPLSGQCTKYSRSRLAELVTVPLIQRYGNGVITTNGADGLSCGYSLAQIGALASISKRIITVATGPCWGCFNLWTRDTEKIVILENMELRFNDRAPVHHAPDAEGVRAICERIGWI